MKFSLSRISPRSISRTNDDAPASSLLGYVRRMSEWHQVALCVLAVVVALVNLVPLELQRRIVNEVVETQNLSQLYVLVGAYAVITVVHQLMKFLLRLYQGWMTESTTIYTRRHLLSLHGSRVGDTADGSGRAISIVSTEVEKLGGFVGQALSQACANAAMLLGVAGYMFFVEPLIAAFALAFLVPQIILTPLMQRRLNALTEERLEYMRDLGDDISQMDEERKDYCLTVLPKIYHNRLRFMLVKFVMKSLLNLLNALAPITVLAYGGYMVMQGETQVGVIVAFLSGFERISSPLRELIAFYRVAAQADVQHRMIARWMPDGPE